jgi:hypothetical protein
VSTGRWLSATVTLKLQLEAFPLLSVAVQVTLVWPTGKRVPEGGMHVTVTSRQLSPVLYEKFTSASHRPGSANVLMSAGHTMRGFSPSSTSTWKEQRVKLWLTSVAVQITVVVPCENSEPLGGAQVKPAIAQLSKACTS